MVFFLFSTTLAPNSSKTVKAMLNLSYSTVAKVHKEHKEKLENVSVSHRCPAIKINMRFHVVSCKNWPKCCWKELYGKFKPKSLKHKICQSDQKEVKLCCTVQEYYNSVISLIHYHRFREMAVNAKLDQNHSSIKCRSWYSRRCWTVLHYARTLQYINIIDILH